MTKTPKPRRIPKRWIAIPSLAICGLAIAIALHERRAAGDWYRCRQHLKDLVSGFQSYQNVHGAFPQGTQPGAQLSPEQRLSWVPLILNFTDYSQTRLLFDPNHTWDSPENRLPRYQWIDSATGQERIVRFDEPPMLMQGLLCPANKTELPAGMPGPMHYVGIAGLGNNAPNLETSHPHAGIFGYNRQTRLTEISDGTSTTMLLAETTLENGPWTAGGPATIRGLDPQRQPYIGTNHQFGGAHRGGAMVAFADGSIRFIADQTAPNIFEAISTISGKETLQPNWQPDTPQWFDSWIH